MFYSKRTHARAGSRVESLAEKIVGAGAGIRTLDQRFKSPSRPPHDASPGLLPYSILRLAAPSGSCDSPGLAIQIGYTSEGPGRSPGARERETEKPLSPLGNRAATLAILNSVFQKFRFKHARL